VMRQARGVGIARPIMLRWLELDAKSSSEHGWTPWHCARQGPP
jgi:hypothetical protein